MKWFMVFMGFKVRNVEPEPLNPNAEPS